MRTKKAENEKITALYERLSRDDEMVGDSNSNKPEKHDEEVPDVWCHSIKADREITE